MSINTDALNPAAGNIAQPTTAAGPVLAGVYTILDGVGAVLNVESAPASVLEFVRPRPGSTEITWAFYVPAAVVSFDVTFYRWMQGATGQGRVTSLVLDAAVPEDRVSLAGGGFLRTVKRTHDGDRVMAVITAITLSSGSLPFSAGSGITKGYRCQ